MSGRNERLNKAQREAVEHAPGALLVVAGPGSGKTRVLTHRIAHMVATGVPAASILAITFTNKAADEMLHRTLDLLAADAPSGELGGQDPAAAARAPSEAHDAPLVATIHSYCARLLRRHIYRLPPYQVNFSIYDSDDQQRLIEDVLDERKLDKASHAPAGISARISSWKNRMVGPEAALEAAGSSQGRKYAQIYADYQRLLGERNAVDFDDLLLLAVRLLAECPDVLDRERRHRRHLLVDEFQDTNLPQYRLVKLLAEEHRSICVTGDPDQSIYGWRGATPLNFETFSAEFPERTVIYLNENYRSTPEIIGAGARLTGTFAGGRELFTRNPPGEPVQVISLFDERSEARKIVEEIHHWREASIPLREIAVLYRTNAQSRSIEEALVRAGIPYTVIGGLAFYQRKEIKDVLAYLRAATFERDELALLRIINVPNRGLGPATLERLIACARGQGLMLGDVIRRPELWSCVAPRARTALESLRRALEHVREARSAPLHRQILIAIEESRYREHLEKSDPDGWKDRADNLEELATAAADTEELVLRQARDIGVDPLIVFLERVSLVSDIDGWDAREHRVSLMTLHAAKGLEFACVVIPGVEETLLPHSRSEDPDSIDEERRLLYVGITRARRHLRLLHAGWRRRFRDLEPRLPSPFLRELTGAGVEFRTEDPPPSPYSDGAQAGGGFAVRPLATAPRAARDFASDVEPLPDDSEQDGLLPGAVLDHEQLGTGLVMRVSGHGARRKITVRFDQHGEKQFLVGYTSFRVLGRREESE